MAWLYYPTIEIDVDIIIFFSYQVQKNKKKKKKINKNIIIKKKKKEKKNKTANNLNPQSTAPELRLLFYSQTMKANDFQLTTGKDKDSLENTLLLHAEVKPLEVSCHREDVDQEGTVIQTTHLVDVKGVATDMCEDEMLRIEGLVRREQPCLEP